MLAIVAPAAPLVKSSRVLSDAEFSRWCAEQAPLLEAVVPTKIEPIDALAINSAWRGGFGHGSDRGAANVTSGPSLEDEAEWLGFQLGAAGIAAELMTPDDDERAAFERGLEAGDDHLWTVDPLFASYLKEQAERFDYASSQP